jgi:hypothetical protein
VIRTVYGYSLVARTPGGHLMVFRSLRSYSFLIHWLGSCFLLVRPLTISLIGMAGLASAHSGRAFPIYWFVVRALCISVVIFLSLLATIPGPGNIGHFAVGSTGVLRGQAIRAQLFKE